MAINKRKYYFYKSKPEYPKLFEKERRRIIGVLPENINIEHVGSTSVPLLGGKGIIDIAIKAPRNKLNQFAHKLERLGYNSNQEHPANDKRIFLEKIIVHKRKERRIHIHLVPDIAYWNSFIIARNYLRANNKERDRYVKIKKEAAKHAKGEGKKYRKYKDEFLNKLVKKALKN